MNLNESQLNKKEVPYLVFVKDPEKTTVVMPFAKYAGEAADAVNRNLSKGQKIERVNLITEIEAKYKSELANQRSWEKQKSVWDLTSWKEGAARIKERVDKWSQALLLARRRGFGPNGDRRHELFSLDGYVTTTGINQPLAHGWLKSFDLQNRTAQVALFEQEDEYGMTSKISVTVTRKINKLIEFS